MISGIAFKLRRFRRCYDLSWNPPRRGVATQSSSLLHEYFNAANMQLAMQQVKTRMRA